MKNAKRTTAKQIIKRFIFFLFEYKARMTLPEKHVNEIIKNVIPQKRYLSVKPMFTKDADKGTMSKYKTEVNKAIRIDESNPEKKVFNTLISERKTDFILNTKDFIHFSFLKTKYIKKHMTAINNKVPKKLMILGTLMSRENPTHPTKNLVFAAPRSK